MDTTPQERERRRDEDVEVDESRPLLPREMSDRTLLYRLRHTEQLNPRDHGDDVRFLRDVSLLRMEVERRGYDPAKIAPGDPCRDCLPGRDVELEFDPGHGSSRDHPGDPGGVYCPRCGLEESTRSDRVDWERAFAYDVGPDDPREQQYEEQASAWPPPSSSTTVGPSAQKARDCGEWTDPHHGRDV